MSSGSAVTAGGNGGGAEGAALGQKLMVHVAENGHSMEFECGGGTRVEAIQRAIEHVCGVPPADQLLLCGNILSTAPTTSPTTISPATTARFRYDFQVANALYQSSVAKYEVCRRLLREWQVQERALDMARSNLEQAFRKPSLRYSNFVRSFTQQHRGYVEVLSTFERDAEVACY
ncbi:hypothetical protein ZWY2020_030248 [Hordeum vulgare]|nr:hypothetical protein ZWY2020_030248 [Hordeum vulgare]